MQIRRAKKGDLKVIQKVCEVAFSAPENKAIMALATNLLSAVVVPAITSLVAEFDGEIKGYVSFSPVFFNEQQATTYILSPIAVTPDWQGKGIGTKLIEAGKKILLEQRTDFLLVYGDPKYYCRFGFDREIALSFIPPCPLKYPFGWLGLRLNAHDKPNICEQFQTVEALARPELW